VRPRKPLSNDEQTAKTLPASALPAASDSQKPVTGPYSYRLPTRRRTPYTIPGNTKNHRICPRKNPPPLTGSSASAPPTASSPSPSTSGTTESAANLPQTHSAPRGMQFHNQCNRPHRRAHPRMRIVNPRQNRRMGAVLRLRLCQPDLHNVHNRAQLKRHNEAPRRRINRHPGNRRRRQSLPEPSPSPGSDPAHTEYKLHQLPPLLRYQCYDHRRTTSSRPIHHHPTAKASCTHSGRTGRNSALPICHSSTEAASTTVQTNS
jgi:hypothetical protein